MPRYALKRRFTRLISRASVILLTRGSALQMLASIRTARGLFLGIRVSFVFRLDPLGLTFQNTFPIGHNNVSPTCAH